MFSEHKPGLLLYVGKTFKFTWLQITKNRCELSAIISENLEITCLKGQNITHVHQLNQVLQVKISFFSHL